MLQGALQALASALVFVACSPAVVASTGAGSWLPQSWYFDWTPPGAPLPVPITAQCETIHVTWQRGTATGPDPVAPYYLQIYSSNYIFPFILSAGPDPKTDITIPFAPGSQYEICMFDSNGNTGGCQGIYTVYSNSSSTPSCANWTMPANTLSVKSESAQGSLSMYGWVDSCSDIKLTPQGGTPPFTFTVAPALHPPFNITSNTMSPINWTVALSWGMPFFISLVDSTGLSWSNGPIHSGDGTTNCLLADHFPHKPTVPFRATVGAAVGGVVFGALVALSAGFLIYRRRANLKRRGQEQDPIPFFSTDDGTRYDSLASQLSPPANERALLSPTHNSPVSQQRSTGAPSLSSTATMPQEYTVEPYYPQTPAPLDPRHSTTGSDVTAQPPRQSGNGLQGTHVRTTSGSASLSVPEPLEHGGSQVYVIHHDSGRAPVSVITSRGTEVVELPPGYSSEFLGERGGSRDATPVSTQRRQRKTAPGSR